LIFGYLYPYRPENKKKHVASITLSRNKKYFYGIEKKYRKEVSKRRAAHRKEGPLIEKKHIRPVAK